MNKTLLLCLAFLGCAHRVTFIAPRTIAIDGDPNGLLWVAPNLYIADDAHNRILRWSDGAGVSVLALLPGPNVGLGQLVQTRDGSLVVVRFGRGTQGDVVVVHADGSVVVVPNLAPTRRRLGLALVGDTLYDTWFEKNGDTRLGGISHLSLDGHEDDVATTFTKPVGIVAMGGDVFVGDQATGILYRGVPTSLRPFNPPIAGIDLFTVGPDDTLFSGDAKGLVYQIDHDGRASVFWRGDEPTRGVAYDAAHHRLFVAEHGTRHDVQILPVR